MPSKIGLQKVIMLGSGPIVIGQAAEFDYAGTQACKALKEAGLEVVLVNNNPATIMTDVNMVDKVYLEPLTWQSVARIIAQERPQGLLPTIGGQTGLNLAVELADRGILAEYGVELLGTSLATIKKAEDRDLFKQTMLEIGEPVAPSAIVTNLADAQAFTAAIGYPVIVRPAYTLGGTGGGFARNATQLADVVNMGLQASPIGQVLLEQSVAGWKEIEYEVMRDGADNCITVCNMENIDPVGIHTGDSIVVAPSQTLSDREYQLLRAASLKIIRALGVEGGCNVQYALNPHSFEYVVIEVNPRVSRSSALASKATGYPIAKMAALIAVGYTLPELTNPVTGNTSACFEPALDYVVAKIPRWPFDKFITGDNRLGTQMKATGEVMALERTFEAALLKAVRSLEIGAVGLRITQSGQWTEMELEAKLLEADHERLFAIAEAFRRAWTLTEVHQLTKIDHFFLHKLQGLVVMEGSLREQNLDHALLLSAKQKGFSDAAIGRLNNMTETAVRQLRMHYGVKPVFKVVDTCAAEFAAATPYYYSTYEAEDESTDDTNPKVIVLGSGPIRIGQGIEFDYCSVHALWALKHAGYTAIMINNNPETVSTDFDTGDKLYFEPLTLEDVMNVVEREKPIGVLVQFGGQTAINLAAKLAEAGVTILGSQVASIDLAEDRGKFSAFLNELGIAQTEGRTATSSEEAHVIAADLEFPVLVRPSYVIGGRAMEVVESADELEHYLKTAFRVAPENPLLIDKYLAGKEVEVDAVSDGVTTLIPGIMEHIERAGVHSGDSMAVYPPQTMTAAEIHQIEAITQKIAVAMRVKGLLNIQYVVARGKVYVIEVNPRASRTVPVISKVTGVPLVALAVEMCLGHSLAAKGWSGGLVAPVDFVVVKAPVFSFEKLSQVDTSLGPEMKSTGEVLSLDYDFGHALVKAFQGMQLKLEREGNCLVSIAEKDKAEALQLVKEFDKLGYPVHATGDTAKVLELCGIKNECVQLDQDLANRLKQGEYAFILNTPTKGKLPERNGFKLRRLAAENRIPCLTSFDTALALTRALRAFRSGEQACCQALNEYLTNQQKKSSKIMGG
ncbi:MAG: carbamoyl-phosphate synthase large subunit [Peptococcaceae bacterium]|nr:carbamoyl-phosphate synthase large subunit [Peptococcaceae bacterium]